MQFPPSYKCGQGKCLSRGLILRACLSRGLNLRAYARVARRAVEREDQDGSVYSRKGSLRFH